MRARAAGLPATLVLLALVGCGPDVPAQPPRLVFDTTAFDFGTVEQGTPVTHHFSFHNRGGSDLIVTNLKTASDTKATAPNRVIAPDGSGTIAVEIRTSHALPRGERTITVYTNDPAHPVTTLTLTGKIALEVDANPPALYLGHIRRGASAPDNVRITVLRPLRLQLQLKNEERQTFEVSAISSGEGMTLSFRIKPNASLGRFAEVVTIETGSARNPTLTVPVAGIVDSEKD